MDLILLVLGLALVGCLVWAIETYIPMPAPFKLAIRIVVAIAIIFYLLRYFGASIPNVLHR